MTYSVEIVAPSGRVSCIAANVSRRGATAAARRQARKQQGNVYVRWARQEDGQHGYLNADGSYSLIGVAW